VQFVFEQILQWQARQHLGLGEGRGEHPGNDDQRRIGKIPIGPRPNLGCYGRRSHLPVFELAIIAVTNENVDNTKNQQFVSLTITRLRFAARGGKTSRSSLLVTGSRPGMIGFASEDDWFDRELENDPRFLHRVEQARKSLQAGRGVRIEEVG